MSRAILAKEGVEPLKKTRDLLDEILETIEVVADKELMRDLVESRREAKKGSTKPFRKLVKELGLEEKA